LLGLLLRWGHRLRELLLRWGHRLRELPGQLSAPLRQFHHLIHRQPGGQP
jgi:hypothetical protein